MHVWTNGFMDKRAYGHKHDDDNNDDEVFLKCNIVLSITDREIVNVQTKEKHLHN